MAAATSFFLVTNHLPHRPNNGVWPPLASKRRSIHASISRKTPKAPRNLIKIGTSSGKGNGNWTCDYLLSLRDLKLGDLVEGDEKDADVLINLSIHRHASFGLSIDGRIITSFTRKCSSCSSPYCRKIDANFNVWVLSSTRTENPLQLPEIGGDDPSVIYVRPGYEAHLDSIIKDTLRLTTAAKDTCSELCEKSEPILQYIGVQKAASIDKRWSRLLELKRPKR